MEEWCKGGPSPIETMDEFYMNQGGLSMTGPEDSEKRKAWLKFSEETNARPQPQVNQVNPDQQKEQLKSQEVDA